MHWLWLSAKYTQCMRECLCLYDLSVLNCECVCVSVCIIVELRMCTIQESDNIMKICFGEIIFNKQIESHPIWPLKWPPGMCEWDAVVIFKIAPFREYVLHKIHPCCALNVIHHGIKSGQCDQCHFKIDGRKILNENVIILFLQHGLFAHFMELCHMQIPQKWSASVYQNMLCFLLKHFHI